jgi:hypothetical protein
LKKVCVILCLAVAYCCADQFISLDRDITWNGPGQFYGPYEGPVNWISPINYTMGFIYRRIEVLEKASDLECSIQSCLWDVPPPGETCGSHGPTFSAKGVYYSRIWGPNWWWKKDDVAVDWDKAGRRGRLLVHGTQWVATCSGGHCLPGAAQHLPVKVHSEEIVTSSTDDPLIIPEEFSNWECQTDSGWVCEGGTESGPGAGRSRGVGSAVRITRLSNGNLKIAVEKAGRVRIANLRGETAAVVNIGADGKFVVRHGTLAPGTYVAGSEARATRSGSRFVVY